MIIEVLSSLVLAFWVLLALDAKRWWPSGMTLRSPRALDGERRRSEARPPVTVVVPARDEADTLRKTLPFLLAQGDDFDALIVVDDRSTDGTGNVARNIAASSPHTAKVRIVEAPPPPPGWSGKIFALETGIRAASGASEDHAPAGPPGASQAPPCWFLFTDADILHPSGSIGALLEKALTGGFDLVSVMVRLRSESLWEKILIPPFVYFFQVLYPFRRVADPRSIVAAAAGGCVLLQRDALSRIGGLAAIREAVIDDVALARRIKDTGGGCWLGTHPDMLSVRAYSRLVEISNMVARTAFTQLRYSWTLLAATLIFLGLFFVGPPVLACAGFARGLPLGGAAALGAWIIESATLLPVVHHQRVNPLYALTLPAAAALYAYMTALSAWRHLKHGGVEWKGRKLR